MLTKESYEYPRQKVMLAYIENMTHHLKLKHPEQSEAQIFQTVEKIVRNKIQQKSIDIVHHSAPGYADIKRVDLLKYVNAINDNIITPSGSIYLTPDKKESFLKAKIIKNGAERKASKNIMLEAEARGDERTARDANYEQANKKISNNSMPGATGSKFNILYDLPGYNSVTSSSRQCVMSGYTHAERLLEGNFYFPNLNALINYCNVVLKVIPKNLADVLQKYDLYIPTVQDLVTHFEESLSYYTFTTDLLEPMARYFSAMSPVQRAYVYYANCLKTVMRANESFFRGFLGKFYDVSEVVVTDDIKVEDFRKVDSELSALITSLFSPVIDSTPIAEAIKAQHPGVRKLVAISRHMQAMITEINDLLHVFFCVDMITPDVLSHPNMMRKCVIVSDTDSVIFTTQSFIEWWSGEANFSRGSYEINAFVVYTLVKSLVNVFARLSRGFGVSGKDLFKISMKNEFLYPLMLRTPLPKHYVGYITIQEGKVLPKPKLDIKGLSLRGSDLCIETNTAAKDYITWLLNTVMENGSLLLSECMDRVTAFENNLYRSLMAGEKTYLPIGSVKRKEEYTIPEQSIYFYYEMWDEVFAPVFGQIILPTKTPKIPIMNKGKAIRSQEYHDYLRQHDPAMCDRLVAFLEKYPKKDISALIIPATMKTIPEIIRPLIDTRGIIYSNGRPFYLLMRALGIGITSMKLNAITMDYYDIRNVA